jgi:hypothetical protein
MTPAVRLLLAGILTTLFVVDYAVHLMAKIDIDIAAILNIALHALLPLSVGLFYILRRHDERMAAVMFSIAFLLLFAPLCTVLNYLAIPIAGHRIDNLLTSLDRWVGISYPALIVFVSNHPVALKLLNLTYAISVFQVAIAIVLLGWNGASSDLSRLCIAVVLCAFSSIGFWTMYPSFGAYTVYDMVEISHRAHVTVDNAYPAFLNSIFIHTPMHIDVLNARGLIGFPSFHTQEIILAIWYLRKDRIAFIPMSIFSAIALAAVPVAGGHHVMDVIGGIVFAIAGIAAAGHIVSWLGRFDERVSPLSTNVSYQSSFRR